MMKHQIGFTLVELMVTLVVAAILLMVGVPSFINTLRDSRTATAANQLVTTLNLARSEAVKRGVQVTVLRTGAEWEGGWSVFSDVDGDGVIDAGDGDTVIQIHAVLGNGYTLRTGANFTDWVAYLPSGRSRGSGALANDTFRLCADDQVIAEGRSIIINTGGRIRTEKGVAECP